MAEIKEVSEIEIGDIVGFVCSLKNSKDLLQNLRQSTDNLYKEYGRSQKVVRCFQDGLTRLSSFHCNRENVIDDIIEILTRTKIPTDLKQNLLIHPIDVDYHKNVLGELENCIKIAKELQKDGFIIGFEMEKDLKPLIEGSVKRIVEDVNRIFTLNNDSRISNWHHCLQESLLFKSDVISFVEEHLPTALTGFITKYSESTTQYYYSCAKGFWYDKDKTVDIGNRTIILIGDPIEGGDKNIFTRNHRQKMTLMKSIFSYNKTTNSDSQNESTISDSIPSDTCKLLIELFNREHEFFKRFFLQSSYGKRRGLLIKIFSKCSTHLKTKIKDFIPQDMTILREMCKISGVEVEAERICDLQIPYQWINEIQMILFEEFKKLIKKQCDSLSKYSELKTFLSSSELHHHFVVKRFAKFMKESLETLNCFQRPWELILVELKKLEYSLYSWMSKVSYYLKDRREALIFQINNYDQIIGICGDVAGVDFITSLKFKFDLLIQKLVKFEHEKYFLDLIKIIEQSVTTTTETETEPEINIFISINSKLKNSFKAVGKAFKSSTFTDFSNISVAEEVRRIFYEKTSELYEKYLEIYEGKFGKCPMASLLEEEEKSVDIVNEAVDFKESDMMIDLDEIRKILYETIIL